MGIDLALWLLMLMVFMVMPLILFIFEVNIHTTYGMASASMVDNYLEQADWHIATDALASAQVNLKVSHLEEELKQAIESKLQNAQEPLKLEGLSVRAIYDDALKCGALKGGALTLYVSFSYEPVTYLGRLFSGERIYLEVKRMREVPVDQ